MTPEHFDVIVIGSGFGGSVTCYRLAEAGLNVCLLERGKAYPPGSFARTPHEMKRNFWDPSEGLYGLFDFWSFNRFESLVTSGLGGGSLIYANVLLRKDADWFVTEEMAGSGYEHWPVTREELDPHYDRVEKMMNPTRYPIEEAPYSETPKTKAFREAAEALDLEHERPPLAITFSSDGESPVPGEPIDEPEGNLHGRTRQTCRLCGECDFGCNYGSKNTLDYNYLSAAEREGADLRTLHEVRSIRPRSKGGYEVSYVKHDLDREGRPTDTDQLDMHTMTADRVVMSAGSLGSTFLMLKNREHLPGLSPTLGSHFSGNGDLLGFAVNAKEQDPEQGGTRPRNLNPNRGPVITSTIRMGDALDGGDATGRGFYLQDAGYPDIISWIVESKDVSSATGRVFQFLRRLLFARFSGDSNLSGELQSLVGGDTSMSTMPLLGMGRDIPDGQMDINKNGYLTNDWALRESRDFFQRLRDTMEDIAHAMGAEFRINPSWFLKRVITVHALGGCPMGRTDEEGVVNAYGEVFNHPGLYVADGSIMPGPIGPNPSLTIAAFADRTAEHIIETAQTPRPSQHARPAA